VNPCHSVLKHDMTVLLLLSLGVIYFFKVLATVRCDSEKDNSQTVGTEQTLHLLMQHTHTHTHTV
jgi:TRAP-type uncharacterized transport system fused permease subunit